MSIARGEQRGGAVGHGRFGPAEGQQRTVAPWVDAGDPTRFDGHHTAGDRSIGLHHIEQRHAGRAQRQCRGFAQFRLDAQRAGGLRDLVQPDSERKAHRRGV